MKTLVSSKHADSQVEVPKSSVGDLKVCLCVNERPNRTEKALFTETGMLS